MGPRKAVFLFLFLLSSVKGNILDDYLRTEGVWILTRNKQFYKTNNERECAEKCEAERNFNCRAFLFTRKKLECLTLAENTKMTVAFNSMDAVLYEKKIYLLQCKKGIGKDYRGTEAKTWRGIPCQNWAEKTPHKPNYTPEKYPNEGLDENYCRNPDADTNGPWCYTTDPATRFDYCNIPECEAQVTNTGEGPIAECMQCNGEDYHGEVSRTESGLECQRWDAQEPHAHGFTLEHFPGKDLRMNYCRNPDGELRPWCFTASPNKRWEYCNIPRCTTHPPVSGLGSHCLSGKGEDYRGRIAITESGKACQHWDTQFPHRHGWIPDRYPCKGLEENYCRNPDGEKRPWCYTINSSVRWEYCAISHCDGTEQGIADAPMHVPVPEECYWGNGQSYRGTVSITASGRKCQAWNSMFPHWHEKTPDKFPNADLRDNYCRNPDGRNSPWCFTTDPSMTWEYCSLRRCDHHRQEPIPNDPPATTPQNVDLPTLTTSDCINGNGKDYRGTVAKTGRGRTCQEWSSQKPHSHKYFTPATHPRAGLDKNYCRNPDGDIHGVWCFTTDPEKKWEYCEIPRCSSSEHDCGKVPMRSERTCEQYSMCDAPPGSWPWQYHCAPLCWHSDTSTVGPYCSPVLARTSGAFFLQGVSWDRESECSRAIPANPNCSESIKGTKWSRHCFTEIEQVCAGAVWPYHDMIYEGGTLTSVEVWSCVNYVPCFPVTITDHVKPVCLPKTSLMVEGNEVCFLAAWGKARDNRLKDVELPVLENRICNHPEFLNGSVKNHEFCGGFTFGSLGNCKAEVGGPLICQDKDRFVQYGITSWGLDCTQPLKPVFVRVPSFVSWIKNTMIVH